MSWRREKTARQSPGVVLCLFQLMTNLNTFAPFESYYTISTGKQLRSDQQLDHN
jgi:hypothetical protein